jgi:hypothetical protein
MSVLGGVGKDTVKEAVQGADALLDEFRDKTIPVVEAATQAVVNNLAGQLQIAAGSMALALGALPETILMALDGLTVEVSPIVVKVSRSKVG